MLKKRISRFLSARRADRSGYSLLELMFSIPSVAFAAIGVMSVLSYGTVAGDTAGDFSTASQLGREIVENIRADRFNNNPLRPLAELQAIGLVDSSTSIRTAIDAPPLDATNFSNLPSDDRFKRNIQIEHTIPGRLAKIQVRVYYQGSKGKEKYVETVALAREAF
ncbi:MAG TPA: hypothetical protein EYO33_12545 [Phycisphaerales bacterium]|nr:hypothetical protein [Phycisphaerales bacterium]